ncbi:MAG: glutamate racemase [Muribaculum sp.]|nr:glutamate racemase [Muribaculum sp.]
MPDFSNLPPGPIGVFDSGYGGLTILKEFRRRLPQYDYLYLADNARAPYGSRSFDVVHDFTLQAVKLLFDRGCNLVILACNTASAKALRSIQQSFLPSQHPLKRVLGIIIPTVEVLPVNTHSGHIGVLATSGTVNSHSYRLEAEKLYGDSMKVTELACPMWVPLVEYGEAEEDGADWFVEKYINAILSIDPKIDTLLLGCTHYPILLPKIKTFAPSNVNIITQGEIVANSLADYLARHPEIDSLCRKERRTEFLTSENPDKFNALASLFLGFNPMAKKVNIS